MKDLVNLNPENIKDSTLTFSGQKEYDAAIKPIVEFYKDNLINSFPGPFEHPIEVLGVDPLAIKEIEETHIPYLLIEIMSRANSLKTGIEHNKIKQKNYEHMSRFMCLAYDKLVILEIGKRFPSAGLDLNVLYKTAKDSFEKHFSQVLWDIPEDEHKQIFEMAFNEAFELIHPQSA